VHRAPTTSRKESQTWTLTRLALRRSRSGHGSPSQVSAWSSWLASKPEEAMLIAAGMVTCLIDHEDIIIATRIIGVAA
jgi:hypothetical protein